jgi:hypothetical protein
MTARPPLAAARSIVLGLRTGTVKKALESPQDSLPAESNAVRFVIKALNLAVSIGIAAMVG